MFFLPPQLNPYLTPTLLDQLPPLTDLLRYLEELTLFNPPPTTTKPLLGFVEELPKITTSILEGVDLDVVVEGVIRMLESEDDEDVVKGWVNNSQTIIQSEG